VTVDTFLKEATARLKTAHVPSARLDCLLLLEDVTGRDRAYLLAHPEYPLAKDQASTLETRIAARIQHTPLAYIRGHAAFYGRTFTVNEHVLVPRPETEIMIEMLLKLPLKRTVIGDIGTGSGCIGITAALELPETTVHLYDIDPLALMTARQNAKSLRAQVTTAHANLLEGTAKNLAIILTNLPYVPVDFPVNKAARHEPDIALYAGTDGLDVYRAFWHQLHVRSQKPEYILTESLVVQHARLAALARKSGYRLVVSNGLIQQFEPITSN
jgi:release factor glutamine methyltransferase